MTKIYWGVFRTDCYKLPLSEKNRLLLKSFDDFQETLTFAKQYKGSAIHLTLNKPAKT